MPLSTPAYRPSAVRSAALAIFAAMALAAPALAQPAEPIRYTLRFAAPATHYVEVEASIPTGGVFMDSSVWAVLSIYFGREQMRV